MLIILIAGLSVVPIENISAEKEEEILMFIDDDIRKLYYDGENIISAVFDLAASSVIFETGNNASLDVKAPKVHKHGEELIVLINNEEVDVTKENDECFHYVKLQSKEPEKIELIFAYWPEQHTEIEDNCETFSIPNSGLYSKNGFEIYLLERGQDADIAFYLDPRMGNDSTTNMKISYKIMTYYDEYTGTGSSTEVSVDSTNWSKPVNLPFSWSESGSYFLRQEILYQNNLGEADASSNSSMQFIIVDKISKAINDKGLCKTTELIPTFNHDFSKVACVKFQTSLELIARGWAASDKM